MAIFGSYLGRERTLLGEAVTHIVVLQLEHQIAVQLEVRRQTVQRFRAAPGCLLAEGVVACVYLQPLGAGST